MKTMYASDDTRLAQVKRCIFSLRNADAAVLLVQYLLDPFPSTYIL